MKHSFRLKLAGGRDLARWVRVAAQFAAALSLFGCTVGPNYVRPPADVPVSYKELGNWKPVQPSDQVAKGNWWDVFSTAEHVPALAFTAALTQNRAQRAR